MSLGFSFHFPGVFYNFVMYLPQNDIFREDVVAELILMVNPLYRIMSVAMLNYKWCLALRSVLGTSGVWPKKAKIITPSPSVHRCIDDKVKKLCKRWGIYWEVLFRT